MKRFGELFGIIKKSLILGEIMEKFKEKIKVSSETMERLNAIDQEYKKSGRKLEFRDKIATAVYMAILDIETENKKEEIEKLEFMDNLNKIICNYEVLKPIISKCLKKKQFYNEIEK